MAELTSCGLLALPNEILASILAFTCLRDIPHILSTCRCLHNLRHLVIPDVVRAVYGTRQKALDALLVLVAGAQALPESVRWIVRAGANVNARMDNGMTPLTAAVAEGYQAVVVALIRLGASVEMPGKTTDTGTHLPLFIAARTGAVDVVDTLLAAGADIDNGGDALDTPLNEAAWVGDVTMVKHLIKKGAEVNTSTIDGCSVLTSASEAGHVEVVRVLLAEGARIDVGYGDGESSPLLSACAEGHVEIVQLLIAADVDVNRATINGWTALMAASEAGHLGVVMLLIAAGSDVNKTTPMTQWAALHGAAFNGHLHVASVLITQGADIDAMTEEGATPLIYAVRCGHEDMVDALIRFGADVNKHKENTYSPLEVACLGNDVHVMRLLLTAGVDESEIARLLVVCPTEQLPQLLREVHVDIYHRYQYLLRIE